jgi:hypothetical protein
MNRKVGLVALIGPVVLATSLLLSGCSSLQLGNGASAPTPSASASSSSTSTPSPKVMTSKAANAQATVVAPSILDSWAYPEQYLTLVNKFGYDTSSYDNTKTKKDDQKFPTFKIGSTRTSQTIWPDSVRPPLTEKSRDEIVARTLAEPDYCAMNAVGLYNTSIVSPWGETISFKANNPWLSKWFPTDASGINDWAAHAMSGSPLEQLRTAKKCALVGALLYQFKDNGVHTLATSLNYHIATADSATVDASNPFGTIREFELNPMQYTGVFEDLEFQLKGWPSKCENQILFNTGDGRFARPDCTPTPPPPTTVTPPKTTPPPASTSCVKEAGGTKVWDVRLGKYICKGPATGDPSYQGHVPAGGAGQAPAQTDTVGPPAAGVPPVTYTVPSGPPATGVPTGSTAGGDTGGTVQGGSGLQ